MRRSRLAPTPSGYLHRGNAASFLLTQRWMQQTDGQLLLRIDDIDKGRRRRAYLDDIFATLAWLDIDYTVGPRNTDDFLQHWSQHLRLDRYRLALAALRDAGHLYACDCTRRQWQTAATDHRYPGTCRDRGLSFDRPDVAWRLRVPVSCPITFREWPSQTHTLDLAAALGDFVVRTKSGLPAYQIVSLVDDLDHGTDTIVRGADLLPSTAAQVYLATLLAKANTPLPHAARFTEIDFLHHPLLTDAKGQKLSKSEGAEALVTWRRAGRSAQHLRDELREVWASYDFS